MSYRVIITPTADVEAMEAFRRYPERSKRTAARWFSGLKRARNGLAENPSRFPIPEEDSGALGREVRLLLDGRRRGVYRILFTVRGGMVSVLRIRHSARGPIEP